MKSIARMLSLLMFGAGSVIAAQSASAQATGPIATPNPAMAPQVNPQGHDAAPTSNGNAPIAPRAQAMPPTVDAGHVAASGADSRRVFVALDRAHRGWLNRSDVSSNQYLSRHFADCDGNHDERLSQDEVNECMAHESPKSN